MWIPRRARRDCKLHLAALACLTAVAMCETPAAAWVTCPDGTMANHGACPGPEGPAGRDGRDFEAGGDWAAMAAAASSIEHLDRPLSLGIGMGSADGERALAIGGAVRLDEHLRLTGTLLRSGGESGLAVGLSFGIGE